jgi:hypothetical protein
MQNFSISFFINNINASQETKHHQQQSKSVDEKKLKLEKTKTMKGLDLKHKNAEYLIISSPSKKKKVTTHQKSWDLLPTIITCTGWWRVTRKQRMGEEELGVMIFQLWT